MNRTVGRQTLRLLRSFGPVDLGEFDGRLRAQKLAFLIQKIGREDGFVYHWHVRGPYSPALTRVLFAGDGRTEEQAAGQVLSEPERRLAAKIRSLMGDGIDDPLELELYASVWYLTPERRLSDEDRRSIMDTMLHTKPHFDRQQVETALSRIEGFRSGDC